MKIGEFLERYHYKVLLAVFVLTYAMGYILIDYDARMREKHHLEDKLENSFVQYKLIYNMYKKDSHIIFSQIKRNKNILKIYADINATNKDEQRKKLYKELKPIYSYAKKLGVKQLHFHLKNCESFLRMHKPQKYGDSLVGIRYSVEYVNKKHRTISGFEQGRILHGFRFVYPLFDKDRKYLGSVEVSISTKSFEEMFENTLFVNAGFIVDKKLSTKRLFKKFLSEKYTGTLESPDYIVLKNQNVVNRDVTKYIKSHLQEYQKMLKKKLATKKAFAINIHTENGFYIKSFIPVKNIEDRVVVAYFIVLKKSPYFENLYKDTLKLKLSLLFFVMLLTYIVHRNLAYATSLQREINRKTDELKASQQRVIEAEKMASITTLVTGIAHEINTPVGLSITAMSHFIDETKQLKADYDKEIMDEDEFEHYLHDSSQMADIVFKNLVRSAKLIEDFKQLSTDLKTSEPTTIDIKTHMEGVVLSLRKKIEKANVDVKIEVDEGLRIVTHADLIVQIFTNLILNSITHAFKDISKPEIKIKIKKKEDMMSISYSDNGIGMDEEHLHKIFDPFYTTNRKDGNTGLGMHIVYNLVAQKLDGSIEVTSKNNEGLHFLITLPIGI